MPFKPGQSGNPSGAKTEKHFVAALRRVLARGGPELIEEIAQQLIIHAQAGEYWAINMLADRLDGKPTQQLQALDEEGRSVAVALITYSDTLQLQSQTLPTPVIEGTGQRH